MSNLPILDPARDLGGKADKWGGRNLFSNDPALLNLPGGLRKRKATLIQIADMGRNRMVHVQMRFSNVVSAANLAAAFWNFDNVTGISKIRVTVRRTVDRQAGPVEEVFDLYPQDTLPIDVVLCRELTVEVEAMDLGSSGQGWIECAACLVANPGPRNLWHPYDVVNTQGFRATSAVGSVLMPANKDRYQFFITNLSTDADMLIGFASPTSDFALPPLPAWPSTNGAFVLPRGGFHVYESPPEKCFKGIVTCVWSGAGTGGALFMEGTVF